MRITHESDYAVRIVALLANSGGVVGAKEISARTGVTPRFTLKILHKLIQGGVAESFRGASGGYRLLRPVDEISLGEIIELIDGAIQINHCLDSDFDCTRVSDKACCQFHRVFGEVNQRLRQDLYEVTMNRFSEQINDSNCHQNKKYKNFEEEIIMTKKFICTICGYIHEGNEAPDSCPQCGAPKSKFKEQAAGGKMAFACEHEIGVAKDVDPRVVEGLRQNFTGECTEVGMYLAMSRQAIREGYPEIGAFYQQAAYEEAEHAAKFAELLGEVVHADTKKNLELRAAAEQGATQGKLDLAKLAKELNYDAIHDTVHEMAKDEARHGKGFEGLLARYFG